MAKAPRWQTPFDRKCKGTLVTKALPPMTKAPKGKGNSMAQAFRCQRPFEGKGKGTLKAKALRWHRQFLVDGKGRSMPKALPWQRPSEGNGLSMGKALRRKVPSKPNALWKQRSFDGKRKGTLKAKAVRIQSKGCPKAKCELYDCNKQTSSLLTNPLVLVRLCRRMLHYRRVG